MAKYRKKPIVIEAVQLRWETWSEMCEFADVGKFEDGKPQGCYLDADDQIADDTTETSRKMGMQIPTLEGKHVASENDWVIRGVKGELYACKPDIFEMTYEEVELKQV